VAVTAIIEAIDREQPTIRVPSDVPANLPEPSVTIVRAELEPGPRASKCIRVLGPGSGWQLVAWLTGALLPGFIAGASKAEEATEIRIGSRSGLDLDEG